MELIRTFLDTPQNAPTNVQQAISMIHTTLLVLPVVRVALIVDIIKIIAIIVNKGMIIRRGCAKSSVQAKNFTTIQYHNALVAIQTVESATSTGTQRNLSVSIAHQGKIQIITTLKLAMILVIHSVTLISNSGSVFHAKRTAMSATPHYQGITYALSVRVVLNFGEAPAMSQPVTRTSSSLDKLAQTALKDATIAM